MTVPTPGLRLALFDLDHTLLPLDSDHSWGRFTVGLGWHEAAAFERANDNFYAHYRAGTLDIATYVRFATEGLRQQGLECALAAQAQYMASVIAPAITPQARALVQAHQAAGDQVLIVTATNEWVTRPIADAFGVSELLAIELERDAQGLPTGAIRGTPSFREGKIARVEQWLAARGQAWADVAHSVFYSDSINDLALLEKVHEPVATNPDPALTEIAQARDWRLLKLFE